MTVLGMKDLIQILMGTLGAVGFALLFGIRGLKLLPEAVGAALGWGLFLILRAGGFSLFTALLFASAGTAVLSEILARCLRTPVIFLLVPMLIPMIPGGDLYYTMSYLIRGDYASFGQYATLVLIQACAIATGILAVSYLAGLIFHVSRGE
ncbi:MAG: threonine/serine exporter family protein [Lachnospiraceae bacterium]|nr:threonine/serine exporter family protein [Lachnospiraceae bacterium]